MRHLNIAILLLLSLSCRSSEIHCIKSTSVKETYLSADIIIYHLIKSAKEMQSVAQPDLTLAVMSFQKKLSGDGGEDMLRKMDLTSD